jgi:tetratricopeptide (TPR) repeat protein
MDDLEELSRLLITLPLSRKYEEIGNYYLALATRRNGEGDLARAAQLLERAAETALPIYRVRAFHALGSTAVLEEKYESGLTLVGEACRLAVREGICDPAITICGQNNVAAIRAYLGDYREALTLLENALPVVRTICRDHQGSLSFKLCQSNPGFLILRL